MLRDDVQYHGQSEQENDHNPDQVGQDVVNMRRIVHNSHDPDNSLIIMNEL